MKLRTPRRLVKLVRYFEGVLDSTTASDKLKAQAADRLAELFLETERGRQQREIALARAEARTLIAQQPTGSTEAPETEPDPQTARASAIQRAEAYLNATKESNEN